MSAAFASLTESQRMEIELGPFPDPPMTRGRFGEVYYRLGDLDAASQHLERGLVLAQEQSQHAVTIVIRSRLCTVARAQGDLAKARFHLVQARALLADRPEAISDPMPAWVDTFEAALLVDEGAFDQARVLGARALVGAQRGLLMDYQSVAAVGEMLAVLAAKNNDLPCAARLLGAAVAVRGGLDQGSPEVSALLAQFGEPEHDLFAETGKLPRAQALELLADGASAPPDAEAPDHHQDMRRR
jgi:hypothetical protein